MKDTRRRMEFFSFYDHTGLERHLARMAEKGWLLDRIGNFTWRYRRIEPKKLAFSVCYFPEASLYDPGPSDRQEMFYGLCAHAGWTLAASSAQMQVFYNGRENPTPIDTDPALEVEAVHKSAKKGYLISQALLASVAVLNIVQFLFRLRDDPIRTLASPTSLFMAVCWPVLLLTIGIDVGSYFLWRRRALRAAREGEFLATSSHPLLQRVLLAIVLASFAWMLSALSGGMLMVMAVSLAGSAGMVLLINGIREALKQRQASAGTNKAVTIGACIVLAFLLTAGVSHFTVSSLGRDRNVPPDELPLSVDGLMDVGDYDYAASDYLWKVESPLLAYFEVHQSPWRREDVADGAPSLDYSVTVVKAPFLYELCRDELLAEGEDEYWEGRSYVGGDPAPWGAAEAYELRDGNGGWNRFLLCYPDRLVEIDFDSGWDVTPAQMAVVGEKLGGV